MMSTPYQPCRTHGVICPGGFECQLSSGPQPNLSGAASTARTSDAAALYLNARCNACERVFSGSALDSTCEAKGGACALRTYIAVQAAPASPVTPDARQEWEDERAAFYAALLPEGVEVVNRVTSRIVASGAASPVTGERERDWPPLELHRDCPGTPVLAFQTAVEQAVRLEEGGISVPADGFDVESRRRWAKVAEYGRALTDALSAALRTPGTHADLMDEHKEQEARSVWERMRILEEALEKAPHAARVVHDDIMCGREGAPVTPQGATYAVEKLLNALRASVAVGPDPDAVDDPPELDVEGLLRVLGSNDRSEAPVSDAEADYICRLADRLPALE